MRILWLTPFSRDSAIGRFSLHVCEALVALRHEVTIGRTESDAYIAAPAHPTSLPVVASYRLQPDQVRADYDVTVLNIGDHYPFHAGIFPFLAAGNGIGILHDFFLFNLFSGYVAANALPRDVWDTALERSYAYDAGERADILQDTSRLTRLADRAPMTEWFAQRCLGAVAHSQHYLWRLDAACPGPTTTIPLAWAARHRDRDSTGVDRADRSVDGPPGMTRVVTAGVINANKCCDQVIAAIAARPALRERVVYRLAGSISDPERARLTALAAAGGVQLAVLGHVTDSELETELVCADVVTCLRSPVLEGASASAIEAMLAGRATVVCDAGFYATLPDDAVVKIGQDASPAEIADVLEALVADPARRDLLGIEARRYAEIQFAPSRYADAFEQFALRCATASPYLELSARVGGELAALGVAARSPIVGGLADRIDGMLPPGWGRRPTPERD